MSRIAEYYLGDYYPTTPGFKSGDTSRDAAHAVSSGVSEVREAIFMAIKAAGPGGLTADEAASKVGRKPGYARPRLSELAAADRIVPTGARRKNPDTGLSAKVWMANP